MVVPNGYEVGNKSVPKQSAVVKTGRNSVVSYGSKPPEEDKKIKDEHNDGGLHDVIHNKRYKKGKSKYRKRQNMDIPSKQATNDLQNAQQKQKFPNKKIRKRKRKKKSNSVNSEQPDAELQSDEQNNKITKKNVELTSKKCFPVLDIPCSDHTDIDLQGQKCRFPNQKGKTRKRKKRSYSAHRRSQMYNRKMFENIKVLVIAVLLQRGIEAATLQEYQGETCLQISVCGKLEVGEDFTLKCFCKGVCSNNTIWTGGPNQEDLTNNFHVHDPYKIELLTNLLNDHEYAIKVVNATQKDIQSNYTCISGIAKQGINLDRYNSTEFFKCHEPPKENIHLSGNVSSGTTLKFNAPSSSDTMVKNGQTTHINTRHQCITAMKEYQTKSLEELRMEDYDANRKGKQPGSEGLFRTQPTATLQQSTGFNFGMTASPFGQQQQQLTSTGSTLFGAQTQSSAGALFGQANKPLFGPATTSTAGFGFGGSTGTGNSLFGNQNEPLFGSTQAATTQSSLFGSSGTTGFGAFGGGAGGFGTSTSTGGLFGTNRPAFGATPVTSTTRFGQTNRFNKPAGTGLFGATAQAPSFGTSTGSSLFGTKQVGFDITTSAPSFSLGATPGGLSGGNTAKPAGFGFGASTGFGGGFNTAQPSLNLGGASTMLSIAANPQNSGPTPQQIQQQLQALNHSPYGDYPLLRNLIQESIEDTIFNIMSDLHDFDHNINSNIKEKERTIIFDTGTEKKEDRLIVDADRDVTLHGSSTDEDLIKDLNGPQGPTGEQGWPGDKGSSGSPGAHGRNGPQGPCGLQDESGTDGGSGSPGLPGVDGLAGAPGESRPVGRSGSPSISGMPGSKGDAGSEGPKGTQGLQGARGDPGISEPPSAEGLASTDGLVRMKGEKGASGDPEAAGGPGYPGPRGPSGLIGSPGSLGAKGAPGQPGEAGLKGENGPKSLHGSSGKRRTLGPPENEGKRGQRGTTGEPGPLGPPRERGDPGRPGSPGAGGARGGSGGPGLDGLAGRPGPAGVTGNDERPGEMGAPGICGPAGTQGPQGKTGSRGEAGSRGPDRNPGAAGFVGAPGIPGGRGEPSKPGEPGPPGEAGKTGRTGANGECGIPGVTGGPGAAGPVGGAGRNGERGKPGLPGAKGGRGFAGPKGEQGATGTAGLGEPIQHGATGFVYFVRSVMMLIMYHILTKTAKYCKGSMRDKFLIVPLILLSLGIVIAPELDECCIQITDYEFGTDLVLECICRFNECTGTKQWTGRPMGTTLALNSHVSVGIQILEQNSFNYTILIKNATIDDWSSNYTCNFGTLSKQISLDGYDQKSTSAVSSITSTHGPDDHNNGGLSGGAIAGIMVGVIFVVAVATGVVVCIRRKIFECCRCQSPSREAVAQV